MNGNTKGKIYVMNKDNHKIARCNIMKRNMKIKKSITFLTTFLFLTINLMLCLFSWLLCYVTVSFGGVPVSYDYKSISYNSLFKHNHYIPRVHSSIFLSTFYNMIEELIGENTNYKLKTKNSIQWKVVYQL